MLNLFVICIALLILNDRKLPYDKLLIQIIPLPMKKEAIISIRGQIEISKPLLRFDRSIYQFEIVYNFFGFNTAIASFYDF